MRAEPPLSGVLNPPVFSMEPTLNPLIKMAQHKADAFTKAVTSDPRWQLEDELMCQVFGLTLYGYLLGVGRSLCFMDVEDIQAMAASSLSGLGIGQDYATGMMQHAHEEFMTEGNTSPESKLVGIGHSHFASEKIDPLVESVFQNTEHIRDSSD